MFPKNLLIKKIPKTKQHKKKVYKSVQNQLKIYKIQKFKILEKKLGWNVWLNWGLWMMDTVLQMIGKSIFDNIYI